MSDSAQSTTSSRTAHSSLFRSSNVSPGQENSKSQTTKDTNPSSPHESSKAYFDSTRFRAAWQELWDKSPDKWKEFVSNLSKVFGLTEDEEEKIRIRNEKYVPTPPLSDGSQIGTAMIVSAVGAFSKVLLTNFNKLHMYDMDTLYEAIEHRDSQVGLLTVTNHRSVLDDPFLLAAILPRRILLSPDKMRWGLCSLDICFQDALIGRTLRLGKAMPICRRGGLQQPFLRVAAEKLNVGDWVHIFPEGRVRQRGMGYSKRGIGKLLAMTYEAKQGLPVILPVYHQGIENVMPQKVDSNQLESSLPRIGHDVYVMTGKPIHVNHIVDRLMPDCLAAGGTINDPPACIQLYEELADFIGISMRLLRAELREKVRKEQNVDLGDPFELS